jgi:PPOX class probable F420-dependent enzyme
MLRMPISTESPGEAARRFLEQPRFASIATLDADGTPAQAVIWYRLEPDGRILVNSRAGRRWCENLRRDPRVSMSVVDGLDGYRWLGLSGHVDAIVEDVEQAREDIIALAHRYHPEGPTASSIATFRRQPRVSFLIRIDAVHDHLEDD